MQEKFHYPLPRDGVKSIQQAIRKVRFEKNEHLYVFKNGSQILRFAGHQNQINIPPEYLFQLKDTEVVHNHTSNSSFSFEDINMATFHNIKKLYAVTPDFIYQVKRPGSEWEIDFNNDFYLNFFETCQSIARMELEKLLANHQIDQIEMEFKFFHYLWLLFFHSFDIHYAQKKHPK